MKLGTFMMPNHPPHRSFAEGHDHDLNYLSFRCRTILRIGALRKGTTTI